MMHHRSFLCISVLLSGISAWSLAAWGSETPAGSQPIAQKANTYGAEFLLHSKYAGPFTQQNLDRIKNALEVPTTRLAALRELIDFAGSSLYQVGSIYVVYPDGSTEIRHQAATAAKGAADEATVMAALKGNDPLLVFWGIWNIGAIKDRQAGNAELERLVMSDDGELRSRAAEKLLQRGGGSSLASLATQEKSPGVIESMLGNNTFGKFNDRMKELLKDSDETVRQSVISHFSQNWIRAVSRQLWIDAAILDGILACAQGNGTDAGPALGAFKQLTNQDKLVDAAAAAAWWKIHRDDWELARYPRWQMPNGSRIYASIQTEGQVGSSHGWHESITLENHSSGSIYVNLADVTQLNWMLYDEQGHAVYGQDSRSRQTIPEWIEMRPGQIVTQDSPVNFASGPKLQPGRYMLRSSLYLGRDPKGLPQGAAFYQVQLPLPLIWVEVEKQ